MADDSGLLIYGNIELSCKIRRIPKTVQFRVANIADDAIMGMSFFSYNKCSLLPEKEISSLDNHLLQCIDRPGYQISS